MNTFFTTTPARRRTLHVTSLAFGYMALAGVLLTFTMYTLGPWIGAVSTFTAVGLVAWSDSHLVSLRKAAMRCVLSISRGTIALASCVAMTGVLYLAPLNKWDTLVAEAGAVALTAAVARVLTGKFAYAIVAGVALATTVVATFPVVVSYGSQWAPNTANAGMTAAVIYTGLIVAIAGGLALDRYLPAGKEL